VIEQIIRISEALNENPSAPPQPVTVRELLNWYGAKRRGENVVARIRADLAAYNLRTVPDFESAWVDAGVIFEIVPQDAEFEGSSTEIPSSDGVPDEELKSIPETPHSAPSAQWIASDPTHQISKLEAANQAVKSVSPNDTILVAVTMMLLHDYSQLPVMTNERTVKGVISWKSIGAHHILNHSGIEVRDAMNPYHELPDTASIFDAIGVVAQHDYVLVRDATQRISGILTASDLTQQFRDLSEPFLLISEIENHLRNMIAARFCLQDFEAVQDPSHRRNIATVADLSFGEYVRLLESEDNWVRFGLKLDRAYFCSRLEVVRKTRNEVMHFDPDGIEPVQLQALEEFVSALRTIQRK
jgi:CBS domain-containing protein